MSVGAVRIDHLVLTVADLDASVAFYGALGLPHETFADGRHALQVGQSKINLHVAGHEFSPRAQRPTPGSGDLCVVVDGPLDAVVAALDEAGIAVEEGPVDRTGALGAMRSVYVRDPDRNLVELCVYPPGVEH